MTEQFDTIVIGGGQAGLAMGYHLARRGRQFLILDAGERVGDSWREHWDSMRLFTPARRDGLPGMRFPARRHSFPTGGEMADYLEAYAERFELPVRGGVRVDALGRSADGRFMIAAGDQRFEAVNVVLATGPFQAANIPPFAQQLDPRIVQLHSCAYRNPAQLPDGDVLVVGAGTSGADIALELASTRRVRLSGELPAEIPFNIEGTSGRMIFPLIWQVWTHVLTYRTPIGRKALPKIRAGHQPLIRVKRKHLTAAGVEVVPRTTGVRDGLPLLDDRSTTDVACVVWCTGYCPAHDWVDLPVLDNESDVACDHDGAVAAEPGLHRLGREFLHAFNSHTVGGVGRDAERIANRIAAAPPVSRTEHRREPARTPLA
jgi:putative flavoprotein involved in K+ transport